MEIEGPRIVTIYDITDDDGQEYERRGPNSWYWVIGMSKESMWGEKERDLERRFQIALKERDDNPDNPDRQYR